MEKSKDEIKMPEVEVMRNKVPWEEICSDKNDRTKPQGSSPHEIQEDGSQKENN